MPQTAIIIGAGPGGLTAAWELLRQTAVRPIVLEASHDIGGLSRTINYKGNRLDIGGHRFFSKSDRVIHWWLDVLPLEEHAGESLQLSYQGQQHAVEGGLAGRAPASRDEVMLVRTRRSRIYYLRKFFDYPLAVNRNTIRNLGLRRIVGCGMSYFRARVFPCKHERTLEEFFINRFGRKLYETFFRSYTEKVWGVPCREISADWGAQRIKGLSLLGVLRHALRKPFATADVAQKRTETSLIERFLYPKFGPGQMWEVVARRVQSGGGQICFGHKVHRIDWDGDRVVGVAALTSDGRQIEFQADYFLSTMPVRDLLAAFRPAPPASVMKVADGLVYRDFIIVGLLLRRLRQRGEPTNGDGRSNCELKDNWIYIQDPDVRIGRLQIFNNWSPHMVADPETVWLGLEYFCNEGDDLWRAADEDVAQLGIDELDRIGLIDRRDVLDHTVVRVPKTYPAYFGTYDQFPIIRDFLDTLPNLFVIGRNGMHRYNNQDHSMLTAMEAVDNIRSGRRSKANIWAVNAEQDYHEIRTSDARPASGPGLDARAGSTSSPMLRRDADAMDAEIHAVEDAL
jgi:protoporphyrinogen oxidase